ncbi:type III-B CRISPR-associated protein Cas10/Cmr2 [Sulfolobus sp. S-194]|uniref:type III-B CRISPR-associated protein Cas10/Cmr2 n=1 Tax=Sulfolobus sp. S-194 TaxID=2512240 RepID=UPI001436ECA1|nr:type III-B CRISPR-associated protein Cas10/Cmr2 [Sulfolobus sp. S-194]QIW24501.1 type III-B CRISPR-associated protein Cas10/Cmr2 [Sulfolobus sp. S-194]
MSTGKNNISTNKFIIQKIKALLHDPPNKPAIISWNAQAKKWYLRRKHETEAKSLAEAIFDKKLGNNKIRNSEVHKADNLASSIDRYLGSIVYHNSSIFPEINIKLKNILLPSLTKEDYDLSHFPLFSKYNPKIPLKPELKESYVSSLKKYYNAIADEILAYQVFYLVYELSWINNNLPIGPADTRNPTHTIFDHLYATAAMMNWILSLEKEANGYLLGIDTIGVADFISKGRKTRDLWISSYLVSALLWYVITWFIEEYGPDVVLFPSLRFNQFYAFYVLEKLKLKKEKANNKADEIKKQIIECITNKVKELITKYIFNDDTLFDELKIPPYPIIPGRVTLILPGLKKEENEYKRLSDENYFISKVKERYEEGWRKLIKGLKLYSDKRREDGFWNLVCRVLTLTEDFLQTTPLNIRVKQVIVSKDEIFDGNNLRSDAWKVYDNKYRQLVSEFKKSKLVKVTPESRLKLFELTKFSKLPQIGEKSKRGYEFCTSCGVLPAVVIMSKEEEFEKKLIETGIARDEKDVESIKKMISPGERLCPWCLVKRALGAEPRLLRILLLVGDLYSVEEIVDNISKKNLEIEIPSTSDIASIKTFEEMINKKEEICNEIGDEICKPKNERLSMWQWFNEMKSKGINLTINPEEHWFSEEYRRYYFSIFRKHNITFPSPYYALVRADSDYLGDLLEGKLTPYLAGIIESGDYANIAEKKEEVSGLLEEYLINAGSGPIVDYVRTVLECIKRNSDTCPGASEIYSNEVAKAQYNSRKKQKKVEEEVKKYIEDEAKNHLNYFRTILDEGRIIVTPAWHVSISSALNRGLITEINLINKHKGFVVYAGGDDLLAFLPVDEVLDFIKESRRAFAGYGDRIGNLCLENGFVRFNNAYYPSLPVVGRSYSVLISHYADPLSMVVNDSYYLLEEGKEMINIDNKEKKIKKDIAIFKYQGMLSVIPLSLKRPIVSSVSDFNNLAKIIDLILTLKKKIDEGKVSTSLLYDYENYRDLINSAVYNMEEYNKEEKYLPIEKSLLKYWIKRNITSLKEIEELVELFKPEYFTVKIESEMYKLKRDLISNIVYTLRIIYGRE